jgi:hypothetical protein
MADSYTETLVQLRHALVTKTGDYTAENETIIIGDATSGSITITLPPVDEVTGIIYHVKKVDNSVNTITIDANSSETIDGATTQVISTQYDSIHIVSDGTDWHII